MSISWKESRAKEIPQKFSPEALVVQQHSWPGNIRELANTVAQALVLARTADHRTICRQDQAGYCRPCRQSVESPLTAGCSAYPGLPDNSKLHDSFEQLANPSENHFEVSFEEVYQSLNRWRDGSREIIACAPEETTATGVSKPPSCWALPRAPPLSPAKIPGNEAIEQERSKRAQLLRVSPQDGVKEQNRLRDAGGIRA